MQHQQRPTDRAIADGGDGLLSAVGNAPVLSHRAPLAGVPLQLDPHQVDACVYQLAAVIRLELGVLDYQATSAEADVSGPLTVGPVLERAIREQQCSSCGAHEPILSALTGFVARRCSRRVYDGPDQSRARTAANDLRFPNHTGCTARAYVVVCGDNLLLRLGTGSKGRRHSGGRRRARRVATGQRQCKRQRGFFSTRVTLFLGRDWTGPVAASGSRHMVTIDGKQLGASGACRLRSEAAASFNEYHRRRVRLRHALHTAVGGSDALR
jgi:hypothetical protein